MVYFIPYIILYAIILFPVILTEPLHQPAPRQHYPPNTRTQALVNVQYFGLGRCPGGHGVRDRLETTRCDSRSYGILRGTIRIYLRPRHISLMIHPLVPLHPRDGFHHHNLVGNRYYLITLYRPLTYHCQVQTT